MLINILMVCFNVLLIMLKESFNVIMSPYAAVKVVFVPLSFPSEWEEGEFVWDGGFIIYHNGFQMWRLLYCISLCTTAVCQDTKFTGMFIRSIVQSLQLILTCLKMSLFELFDSPLLLYLNMYCEMLME